MCIAEVLFHNDLAGAWRFLTAWAPAAVRLGPRASCPNRKNSSGNIKCKENERPPVKGTLMNGNTHLNKTRGRMPLVLLGECCFSQHTAARASYPPRILPESEGRN